VDRPRYLLFVSRSFRLYLSDDDFPDDAWQEIMGIFSAKRMQEGSGSEYYQQWMTKSRVWAPVRHVVNTRIGRPAWASWEITLDFSRASSVELFDAASIAALALVALPRDVAKNRLCATDAFDDASAEDLDEWAKLAARYLDEESVSSIVGWAKNA